MKRILILLLLLFAVLIALYFRAGHDVHQNEATSQMAKTNSSAASVSQSSASSTIQTLQTNDMLDATGATNLAQWKSAIPNLKKLRGFTASERWLVEQPGRKTGLPVILSQGGKDLQYSATLISIESANETGKIFRVELQTPNLNIDETRQLGMQLCNMLDVDAKPFLAWCDKVGNHWLDAPLYSTGNSSYGFGIHRTYSDVKPWYVNFVIVKPH